MIDLLHSALDFILHIDQHLKVMTANYGAWIYAILFGIVFCETGLVIVPFLPGDSLLFVAGALAALGNMDMLLLTLVLFTAAVLGDNLNYFIGRRLGKSVFGLKDSRFFKRETFDKAHDFFERYGGRALIMARFMPLFRTFMPFTAGVSAMSYRRFLSFSLAGGAIWVITLTQAGYWLGSIQWVQKNLQMLVLAIIFISFLPALITYIKSKQGNKHHDHA